MKKHLAIFSKEDVEAIFNGKKTLDIRLSQRKIPPFGEVSLGDFVYIKPVGDEIKGQFLVKKVIFLEGIDEKEWVLIKSFLKGKANQILSADYFEKHLKKTKYATIIFLDRVEQFITSPIRIPKKDLRGWIVLDPSPSTSSG